MKELTIEEKAKRYDEAIEKGKQIQNTPYTAHWDIMKEVAEHLLPELKESGDERIRKALIKLVKKTGEGYENVIDGVSIENAIAWLENQGEQNIDPDTLIQQRVDALADIVEEQKPADKVEPKFKVGNWYQCTKDFFGKGVTFDKNTAYYCAKEGCLQDEYGCHIAIVKDLYDNFKLWTIQDVKDGDVLCYKDEISLYKGEISLYKHDIKDWSETSFGGFVYYCCYDCKRFITDSFYSLTEQDKTDIHPATKEQRDLLFAKMKEAGYEWDAEKKELKKIEQKSTEDVDLPEFESYLCLMFQKFRAKGMCTNGEIIDYVKEHSQKLRDILVKPAWSEEDEKIINKISIAIANQYSCDTAIKIENWLKFLRPQNRWKPSKEQMTTLRQVISGCSYDIEPLVEIEEQLKKLREE